MRELVTFISLKYFHSQEATRTGRMTREPSYPEGHPKRIEQDSRRNNIDVPSSSKKKKKKNDRTMCYLLSTALDFPEEEMMT